MTIVNATTLRSKLFDYLAAATTGDIINVTTKSGNVVMVSQEEYEGMIETMHLLSIPGMREKLLAAAEAGDDEYEDFSWD